MYPNDKNRIENLKKTLYSREKFKPDNPVHTLTPKQNDINESWQTNTAITPIQKNRRHWPLTKILVWFSISFFVIAAGIAGYIFYNGYNTISADNVDVTLTGPTTIDAGRIGTIQVSMDNKNQIDLQDAYLTVDYPDGARRDPSATEPLIQDRISLGNIASGAHLDRTISAVFFGLQGTQEKVKINLEYHVLGSLNLFAKTKDYLFSLGAGPISMVVTHVGEVNSGQNVTFTVVVTSNSATNLSNLSLNTIYPFGFTLKSAVPAPSANNSVWRLGDIAPGESKTVTITGSLEGQENEQRAFKFNVGLSNPADTSKLATIFYAGTETVAIQKPFIGLDMAFDGAASTNYQTSAGRSVNVTLTYSNNMSIPIVDGVISLKITGAILDKSNIDVSQGFYQSVNDTITWDKRSVPGLAALSPGDHGTVQFTFRTMPFTLGSAYTKSSQKVSMMTSVSANQSASTGATAISSSLASSVLINSDIALTSTAVYNGGLFKNTGPVPPKAEKETTYTINWSIKNTFNNVSNVVVSTVLPANVKFLNNIIPQNESVSYDPVSGKVDWTVGNVKTNTGYNSAPRQVSFQVSILPSLNQVGSTPTLISEVSLKAQDAFTGVALSAGADSISTEIVTDPQYKYGMGVVSR